MVQTIESFFIKDYPYQSLANAIVYQAAEDYRTTCDILKIKPNDKDAAREQRKILKFFRSEWFTYLTNLDPEALIERLDKEYAPKPRLTNVTLMNTSGKNKHLMLA